MNYIYRMEAYEVGITATLPAENVSLVRSGIDSLKSLHISTAINCIGERQASLKSIKTLGLDTIKIDRYFIRDIADDKDSYEVFTGLVKLGSCLSKNILAEGVETKEQFELVRKIEIDEAQGHFFTQPLELHFFDQWRKEFDKKQKQKLKLVQQKKSSL